MNQTTAWVSGFAPRPVLRPSGASHCPLRQHAARTPAVRTATVTTAHASPSEAGSSATAGTEIPDIADEKWDGSKINADALIENVTFNPAGLVAAVAQQVDTKEVLMLAWMSEESIRETMRTGRAVYFSRSRQTLWRKGETSGQVQYMRDLVLDCDGDTILLVVNQIGVACHTGRRSCFYNAYRPPLGEVEIIEDVLIDPHDLYGSAAKK